MLDSVSNTGLSSNYLQDADGYTRFTPEGFVFYKSLFKQNGFEFPVPLLSSDFEKKLQLIKLQGFGTKPVGKLLPFNRCACSTESSKT